VLKQSLLDGDDEEAELARMIEESMNFK